MFFLTCSISSLGLCLRLGLSLGVPLGLRVGVLVVMVVVVVVVVAVVGVVRVVLGANQGRVVRVDVVSLMTMREGRLYVHQIQWISDTV